MGTTPVFLPEESYRERSLAATSIGLHRGDMTEATAHTQTTRTLELKAFYCLVLPSSALIHDSGSYILEFVLNVKLSFPLCVDTCSFSLKKLWQLSLWAPKFISQNDGIERQGLWKAPEGVASIIKKKKRTSLIKENLTFIK